eukprot:scaffold35304_cov24-Tisochrysis_lutea.AAC.1
MPGFVRCPLSSLTSSHPQPCHSLLPTAVQTGPSFALTHCQSPTNLLAPTVCRMTMLRALLSIWRWHGRSARPSTCPLKPPTTTLWTPPMHMPATQHLT